MPKLKKRSTGNHAAKMREKMRKRRNRLVHAMLIPWLYCGDTTKALYRGSLR